MNSKEDSLLDLQITERHNELVFSKKKPQALQSQKNSRREKKAALAGRTLQRQSIQDTEKLFLTFLNSVLRLEACAWVIG